MDKQEYRRYLKTTEHGSFKDLPCSPFYNHLDNKMGFGFHGRNIYTLTGVDDKRSLALQTANFTAKSGFKTLYYSLIDTAGELIDKCVSRYTYKQSPNEALSALEVTEKDKAIDKFFSDVKDNLVIVDNAKFEHVGEDVLEGLEHDINTIKPKLVIIDSFDLLAAIDEVFLEQDELDRFNLENHLTRYAIDLKRLAQQKNIPILIAAENPNSTLQALSSVILNLQDHKELDDVRVMKLEFLKNRHGDSDTTYLAYRPAYNAFISVNNPEFFDYSNKSFVKAVDNG